MHKFNITKNCKEKRFVMQANFPDILLESRGKFHSYRGKADEIADQLFIELSKHKNRVDWLSPGNMDRINYALYKRAWKAFGRNKNSYRDAIRYMLFKYNEFICDIFGKRLTVDSIYHNTTRMLDSYINKVFSILMDNSNDLSAMYKTNINRKYNNLALRIINDTSKRFSEVFNLMISSYKKEILEKFGKIITYKDVIRSYKTEIRERKRKRYTEKLFGILVDKKNPLFMRPGNMLYRRHIYGTIIKSKIWRKGYIGALSEMLNNYDDSIVKIFGRPLTLSDFYQRSPRVKINQKITN